MKPLHLILILALTLLASCSSKQEYNSDEIIPIDDISISFADKLNYKLGNTAKMDAIIKSSAKVSYNGYPELSIKYCNKALELDSKSWKAYLFRGAAYVAIAANSNNIDDYKKAAADFDKSLSLNKKHESIPLSNEDTLKYTTMVSASAEAFAFSGKTDKAISLIQSVLVSEPDNYVALRTLLLCYCMSSNYRQALTVADRMYDLPEFDIEVYFMVGQTACFCHEYHEAIYYLEKYLELGGTNRNALSHLSSCYLRIGDYEKFDYYREMENLCK